MFRFANPEYLYLLLLLPVVWALYFYGVWRNRRNMARMGRADVLGGLMPDVSRYKPGAKFFLQQLALLVLVFLVARPQMGAKLEVVKRQGVEIMIALDVSNSMLAQDIAPSRLERSKMLLSRLFDDLDEDKVGLIVLPAMLICSSLLRPILFRLKCFLPISLRRWCRLREQP